MTSHCSVYDCKIHRSDRKGSEVINYIVDTNSKVVVVDDL